MPDLQGEWATGGPAVEGHPHWDRDEVHEVYRGWRRVTDSYAGDRVFVGEVWVQTPERLARYLRDDELHTAFNFTYLLASWDATSLRTAIDDSIDALSAVGAPATWVLSNHDVVRHVTRYGRAVTDPATTRPRPHSVRDGRPAPDRDPASAGGHTADARPARWGLRLPGRGAGVARGRRPAGGGAAGPGLRAIRPQSRARGRRRRPTRRVPGADPVVGRRAPVRLRARFGPAVVAAARRVGGADGREAAGRSRRRCWRSTAPRWSCATTARSWATARWPGSTRTSRCSRSAATRASCAW